MKGEASPHEAGEAEQNDLCLYNERQLHQTLDYRTPTVVYYSYQA